MIGEWDLKTLREIRDLREDDLFKDIEMYRSWVHEQAKRWGISPASPEFRAIWEISAELWELMYRHRSQIPHVWGRLRQDDRGAELRRAIILEIGLGEPRNT